MSARDVVVGAIVLVILIVGVPRAQSPGFGLGVILGEPTGISAKAWLSGRHAVDAAVAWSVRRDGFFQVHADALVHEYGVLEVNDVRGKIPFSYGVGGRIILGKRDEWIGVRFPLGVSYLFPTAPFDVFLEIVPILDLLPETDFDLDAAVGGRFYFGGAGRGSEDVLVRRSRF
jgi:hypothetical protein